MVLVKSAFLAIFVHLHGINPVARNTDLRYFLNGLTVIIFTLIL